MSGPEQRGADILPRTILSIDDDRKVLEELKAALPRRRFRLLHTADLEEAARIAREEEPDLVLLEIQLDRGDGLDWLDRVRAESVGSELPVVIVTSAGRTPGLYGRAVQLGAHDYLTKPVLGSQLVSSVKECLGRKRATSANLDQPAPTKSGLASGRLQDLPLAEVLDQLHRKAETGVLIVGDAQERTGIQIRNGSPTAVSLGDTEAIEDFLVRTGRIRPGDRDRICQEVALGHDSAEVILLGMGAVDEEGLDEAARERAEEAIFRLFELEKGRFRFESGRRLKSARTLDVSRSAESIIVRGVLAHAPSSTIHSALSVYSDLFAVAGANPEPTTEDVPFSTAQREFILDLVGDRTVGDFLELGEFEQRTLYAFAILGAVDLRPDPMLVLEEVLEDRPAPKAPVPKPTQDEPVAPDDSYEDELFAAKGPDGAYEDKLFSERPRPSESVRPEDRSYEEDLFVEMAFEEDSFEEEMVEQERGDPEDFGEISLEDALVEIDDLLPPEEDHAPEEEEEEEEAADEVDDLEEDEELEEDEDLEEDQALEVDEDLEEDPALEVDEDVEEDPALEVDEDLEEDPALEVDGDLEEDQALDEDEDLDEEQALEEDEDLWEEQVVEVDEAPEEEQAVEVDAPPDPELEQDEALEEDEDEETVDEAEDSESEDLEPEPETEDEQPEPLAAAPATEDGSLEVEVAAEESPEPIPAKKEPPAAPAVADRRPRRPVTPASKSYEIAPFGRVSQTPEERAEVARRVQTRLKRRYGHLVERTEEAAAGSSAAAPEASAASRALEAETWFRKGRDLLKTKKYEQAVEAFGMSTHLDPSQGEYVAHLGYTLYLSKPDDETVRKEALEDIARGIKLSPESEMSYVYLGRIFKVMGDMEHAEKMFSRALKIRPHCREAVQEMRLIRMRQEKKKGGLLGRFGF
jgi:DNA-binding response OmpR family regulator/tetratricopeptide (TPR) repeat protein